MNKINGWCKNLNKPLGREERETWGCCDFGEGWWSVVRAKAHPAGQQRCDHNHGGYSYAHDDGMCEINLVDADERLAKVMKSYPPRVLDRRLQEAWARLISHIPSSCA